MWFQAAWHQIERFHTMRRRKWSVHGPLHIVWVVLMRTFYTCVVLKGVTCQIVCSICCVSFCCEQNDCIIMIVCYVHSLSFIFAMDFHHVALHVGMLGWKRDAMRFEKIAAEVNLETVPWIPCKLQGGSWKFGFVWDGDIFQISLTNGSSGISWLVKLYNPSKKQWCIECYITIRNDAIFWVRGHLYCKFLKAYDQGLGLSLRDIGKTHPTILAIWRMFAPWIRRSEGWWPSKLV